MPRLFPYYKAGKVKCRNEPQYFDTLVLLNPSMYLSNDPLTPNPCMPNTEPKKYSKYKKIRRKCEKLNEHPDEAKIVERKIEKFESGLEDKAVRELLDSNKKPEPLRKGRNHKKWHGNHREKYSNREEIEH